jgi:hypothetical protein
MNFSELFGYVNNAADTAKKITDTVQSANKDAEQLVSGKPLADTATSTPAAKPWLKWALIGTGAALIIGLIVWAVKK